MPYLINHALFIKSLHYLLNQALSNKPCNCVILKQMAPHS